MPETVPDFRETAVAVAAGLGVACDEPVVLAQGMSTVVHLRPSPIVARVTRLAHLIRPIEEVAATVALARALPGLAAPPTDQVDPGPHLADGRYVTLWAHVTAGPATAAEGGASLRAFHQAARQHSGGGLRSYDPRLEADRIGILVGGEAGAVLRDAAAGMSAPQLAELPIHGDAHLANALAGGLWLDFDEACLGPPEWDLACLRHCSFFFGERAPEHEQALKAYGPFDEAAVAALDPLVVLFTAAWGATAPLLGNPIGPRTQRRLEWLRARCCR